jgi:hypothetical protein
VFTEDALITFLPQQVSLDFCRKGLSLLSREELEILLVVVPFRGTISVGATFATIEVGVVVFVTPLKVLTDSATR